MLTLKGILKPAIAATFLALAPIAVGATTYNPGDGDIVTVEDGDIVNIAPSINISYIGDVVTDGGPGSVGVIFDASVAGLGTSKVTIGSITAGQFTGLTISWIDMATNGVLGTILFAPDVTVLSTTFADPDTLVQKLLISWDTSSSTGFDFEGTVATVPVPAAGFLLLGALGGLGFAGRRRRKAA